MSTTHYNLILVGLKGAGKSSTGNTILGRDSFTVNTTQQPATHGLQKEMVIILGAHFNVYDVPGLYEEEVNNEELLKKMQGLELLDESLPTVILLALKTETPSKERKHNTENIIKSEYEKTTEFIKKLPKWVRQNTWLLFTRGDELERERIHVEEIINQNEELKRLVEKLHYRYHVFNNKSSESSDQVIQLVKKIQEAPLKMSPTISHFPRTERPLSERNSHDRRIVLLGKSGAGKSATANSILGKKRFKSMLNPASVTTKSEMEQGLVAGKKVSIVDTPGLFDTSMSADDLGVEIGRSVYLSSPGPHAFLYVLPINSRFTKQEEDVVQEFEKMFGEEMRKYTIVLFTQGDQLEEESAGNLIKMNSSLYKLVEQCGGGYHVFNNKDLSNRQQVTQLMEKIDRMVEKNGGSCYCNQMFQDAARFKKEAEESRRRNKQGDQKKREKVHRQNEKENVQKETVVKAGKQFLEEAAKLMQKTRKYIQEQRQEETEVRRHKETVRFRPEIMRGTEKTERKEPVVKAQSQIFRQKEGTSRQNQGERRTQKEQRKEKMENITQDGDVRVKRQICEKITRCCSEKERKSCSEELTVEVKERSADAEKGVKAKMQIFEKSKFCTQEEKEQWKEKETKKEEEQKQKLEHIKTKTRTKLKMFEQPRSGQEEEEMQQNEEKKKLSKKQQVDDEEDTDDGEAKSAEEKEIHKKVTEAKLKMLEEAATCSEERAKNTWMKEEKKKHTVNKKEEEDVKEKEEEDENSVNKRGLKTKLLTFEKGSWIQDQEKQRQKEGENRKQRVESQQNRRSLYKETDVMVKMQMFEEASRKQEEEENRNNGEQEKRKEEKRKSLYKETNVTVKMQMFEKEIWKQEEEIRNNAEKEKQKEEKRKSLYKETNVTVKMQMFEKESWKQEEEITNNSEEEKQKEEKRKSLYEETVVKGMMVQTSLSCKIDEGKGKQKDNEKQERSRHNETPEWNVQMDRHSKDCQENENQKREQHEQEQGQAEDGEDESRQENKKLVDREYETIFKNSQNVEEIATEESTTNTQTAEDDPGLEQFLQQHSNHLSAAGQVGISFRQKVAAGASAGCAAGASIGATVGIVLGPVGVAVGSAIGGFIGGVGGAVGGVFRAILS